MGVEHFSDAVRPVDHCSATSGQHYAMVGQRLEERKQVDRAIPLVVMVVATGRAGLWRTCSPVRSAPGRASAVGGTSRPCRLPGSPGRKDAGRRRAHPPSSLRTEHFAPAGSPTARSDAVSVRFFKRSANCLVAESVHDSQFHHLVRQKAQAPLRAAFWGLRTGKADQLRLFFSIKLAIILSIWTFALDRSLKVALAKALADAGDSSFGKLEGLRDPSVWPRRSFWTFVCFQQNPSTGLLTSRAFSSANPIEQAGTLIGSELDTVFLRRHWTDSRYSGRRSSLKIQPIVQRITRDEALAGLYRGLFRSILHLESASELPNQ